jgi:hypothetical protein
LDGAESISKVSSSDTDEGVDLWAEWVAKLHSLTSTKLVATTLDNCSCKSHTHRMSDDIYLRSTCVIKNSLNEGSDLKQIFGVVYKLEFILEISESPHGAIDFSLSVSVLKEILN